MNRRLRKKLHLGEFRELYAEIDLVVDRVPSDKETDLFFGRLADDGIIGGGSMGRELQLTLERCTCAESLRTRKWKRRCHGSMDENMCRLAIAIASSVWGIEEIRRVELHDMHHCDGVRGKRWL